jgi:internalin A
LYRARRESPTGRDRPRPRHPQHQVQDGQAKLLENQLRLTELTAKELATTASDLTADISPDQFTEMLHHTGPTRGQLKALHTLLEEQDPDFAGLQRVRVRDQFRWVHPRFKHLYD